MTALKGGYNSAGHKWRTAVQAIFSYSDEGGIAKMLANHLGTTAGGGWMLPVWREMGGQQVCNMHPELHGQAGVLLSDNQVQPSTLPISLCSQQHNVH